MATQTIAPEPLAQISLPAIAGAAEAVVQAGGIETPYRRAGHGAKVLLLASGEAGDGVDQLLFNSLAGTFRVFAPVIGIGADSIVDSNARQAGLCSWLRDLIDGLGLIQPSIVADGGTFGMAALSLALTDPDRVDRVVVICHTLADCMVPLDLYNDALQGTGHPVLGLRLDSEAGTAVCPPFLIDKMLSFLAAEAEV